MSQKTATKLKDSSKSKSPPEASRSEATLNTTNPECEHNETDTYSDSIHCDLCIQTEAENFCLNCKQYLCSRCQTTHQRGTTTKDHKIVGVEDVFSASIDKPQSEFDKKGNKTEAEASEVEVHGGDAMYEEQIDISTAAEKVKTIVSAIEVTEDGGLIVCDMSNQKVKLFDNEHELLSEVSLTSRPMGMVMLSSTDLAVSLPEEKCLQNLKLKKGCLLALERKVKTKLKCFRLLRYNDQILAYAQDDLYRFFNIMDTEGNNVRCIMNEPKDSGGVFTNVFHMGLSINNGLIYVTDGKKGCVGLSLNGNMEFTYKEPMTATKMHHGICAGPGNSAYLACNDSDKVVVIDNKGKKVKDLICVKGMKPAYLAYSKAQSKLYVKRGGTNKVLVYAIKA